MTVKSSEGEIVWSVEWRRSHWTKPGRRGRRLYLQKAAAITYAERLRDSGAVDVVIERTDGRVTFYRWSSA